MDELDLLARLGADVAPMSEVTRTRIRGQVLAKAGELPAAGGRRSFRPAPRRRRRVLRGGVLVGSLAAAATAFAVAAPIGGVTPAYALDRKPDGTVSVQIREFVHPEKLQAGLRAAGVPAVVDYVPSGQACRQPRGRVVNNQGPVTAGMMVAPGGDHQTTFQVSPGTVRAGQTLVVEASYAKDHPTRAGSLAMSIIEGPVLPCQPGPAPAPPAAGQPGTQSDGGRPGTQSDGGQSGTQSGGGQPGTQSR
jgi:hypothetical protein